MSDRNLMVKVLFDKRGKVLFDKRGKTVSTVRGSGWVRSHLQDHHRYDRAIATQVIGCAPIRYRGRY